MSIECAVCERDARGGHAEDCPVNNETHGVQARVMDIPSEFAKPDVMHVVAEWPGLRTVEQLEELEELKRQWLRDPIWDLESSEGFEAYRQQLKEFADTMRVRWATEQQAFEKGYQQARQESDPTHWLRQIANELQGIRATLEYMAQHMR
jgi:hypothetical protein